MNENQELAMCGCRCDLCKAYAPNVEKNDQRKTLAEMWNKYYSLDSSVMDSCGGCRNNPSDENCPVRKCVLEKGLNHCGDCGDFSCNVFYQRCGSFSEEKKKCFDMDEYNEYILAYDNETRLREYKKEQLKKVGEVTMRFMRGNYLLDEVGSGTDELKFCDGEETILTIYIRDRYYGFLVNTEKQAIIKVADMDGFETVKRLILSRKKPNRKPFPEEQAVYSRCGMRCDLCVHYMGGTVSKELKKELQERITRVYGGENSGDWDSCPGCGKQIAGVPHPCMGGDSCWQLKCLADKGLESCRECTEIDKHCIPQVGYRRGIEARSISADDVTWAILPYVHEQYGN